MLRAVTVPDGLAVMVCVSVVPAATGTAFPDARALPIAAPMAAFWRAAAGLSAAGAIGLDAVAADVDAGAAGDGAAWPGSATNVDDGAALAALATRVGAARVGATRAATAMSVHVVLWRVEWRGADQRWGILDPPWETRAAGGRT
ncbi:MAG TPA: hypothetical protein VGJ07_10375 [Rugosimonospora sp.]